MSWTITGKVVNPPLIDAFPGAAAAYSLRSLTAGNVSVVRIRRSSDNTEQDFTAAQVTDGALTTFCGAGNGFVRTWYDQSGNSNHVIQTSTASQPQLVSSGSLLLQGTRPALQFDGSNDRLTLAAPTTALRANPTSIIGVLNVASFNSEKTLIDVGNNRAVTYGNTSVFRYYRGSGAAVATSAGFSVRSFLVANYDNGTSPTFWINNQNFTISNPTGAFGADNGMAIGATAGTNPVLFHNSTIQELLFYPSNQVSSRAAIEANINDHYSIY